VGLTLLPDSGHRYSRGAGAKSFSPHQLHGGT